MYYCTVPPTSKLASGNSSTYSNQLVVEVVHLSINSWCSTTLLTTMQLTSGGRTRHFSDCINFPKIVPISTAGRSPLVWSGFLAPLISTLKTVQSHTTILLLESPCSLVRPLPKNIASKIYAPYIHASFRIKVQDHR